MQIAYISIVLRLSTIAQWIWRSQNLNRSDSLRQSALINVRVLLWQNVLVLLLTGILIYVMIVKHLLRIAKSYKYAK